MLTTLTFGTAKRIGAVAVAVAVVVAAAVVVGQAPAIFGADVQPNPEASIAFEDQRGDGTNVTIDAVELSDGGFVVVSDGDREFVGVSEYLEPGEHENVTVEQDEEAGPEMVGELTATVHRDSPDDGEFRYEESDGEEDQPYLEHGYPVSDTATVTMADRPADAAGSEGFMVESISGPSTATTTQTVAFTGEVRNPSDHEARQYVELRIDGAIVERQVFTLEADETREVTFEVSLENVEPGDRIWGLYTSEDGALDEIRIEFDGPPRVSVVEAEPDAVVVDAGLPEDGFVAVEDADGEVLGTSEALEAGLHENVTVELDEPVDGDGGGDREDGAGNLTAVLYEGDPDDLDGATPFEHEGERVEAPIEFEADGDGGDGDDEVDAAERVAPVVP